MRKRPFMVAVAISVLLISVAVGMQFVDVAKGNSAEVNPSPAFDRWVLIFSPTQRVYNSSVVTLSFNNYAVSSLDNGVTSVLDYSNIRYFLDGALIERVTPVILLRAWSYKVNLTGLADGQHFVEVKGTVTARADLETIGLTGRQGESFDFSRKVTFTVDLSPTELLPSPSPSPSPTIEPTLEHIQTATPTTDDNPHVDLKPILVLSGIAVAAFAVGAWVYFKRRKIRG